MFGLSFWELGVVLLVALLALGPKRLPEVLRSLGRGMRELRRASAGLREAIEEPLEEVRRPLREIRDDVASSLYKAGRDIEQQVRREIDSDAERVEAEIDSPLIAAAATRQIAPDASSQAGAPQGNAPWVDAPGGDLVQADAPWLAGPQADAQADAPQADAPQAGAQADAQADAPQADAQADAPQADAPQADAPQADAQADDRPVTPPPTPGDAR